MQHTYVFLILFLQQFIGIAVIKHELPIYSHLSLTTRKDGPRASIVQECPQKCTCVKVKSGLSVECMELSLNEFPTNIPHQTLSLLLATNNLTSIDDNSVSQLQSLEKLDVSHNSISSITGDSLNGLHELIILDLSYNKINFIPSTCLLGKKNLQILNLSHNLLTTVSPSLLYSVSLLQKLDVSYNFLEDFDENQFVHLQKLRNLDLSQNHLSELKHDWFQRLDTLQTLNMSNNLFLSINNLMFVNLVELQQLDLSDNTISTIRKLSFKGLVKLKLLHLNCNSISRLPYRVFSLMNALDELDLSENPFMNLKDVFYRNHNLRFLKLNNLSKIERVEEGSFDSLTGLEELSIRGNKRLSSIHRRALYPLQSCKYVNLTFNNLTAIPSHSLDRLHKLRSISLYGNPWTCDCKLFWIFEWLRSVQMPLVHFNQHRTTFCAMPIKFIGIPLLDALDEIPCANASIIKTTKNSQFKVGASALLECKVDGFPIPNVTWLAPDKSRYIIKVTSNKSSEVLLKFYENQTDTRVFALNNGNLFIRELLRNDGGYYFCTASNVMSNTTKPVHLMLDYKFMNKIKIYSVLVGLALSIGFLVISLITSSLGRRFGWHCCGGTGSVSPKTKQIRKMLEYMEQYKEQQLEKLRENYTQQTHKIKDNCNQQMEKLREGYSMQFEKIQNICDFGTQQIDKVRDNYTQQVQRVRDYSAGQLDKLRENYLYQRSRIRKFSAHHLYKLRENCKLQQQHLNKILENLNLESCRTVCARTESIIFEPQLSMETVFRNQISCLPDPLVEPFNCDKDTLSQNSAYFTPNDSMSRAESPGPSGNSSECLDQININIISEDEAAGGSQIAFNKADSTADIASLNGDDNQQEVAPVYVDDNQQEVAPVYVGDNEVIA